MAHDPAKYRAFFQSLTSEQIAEANAKEDAEHQRQVERFRAAYKNGECYLCGESFESKKKTKPCTHWLLRRTKFKKSEFPDVYRRYDYHNIAAFLRLCANEEKFLRNINDLEGEKSAKKIFSYTVKWKNVEWTFDCSEGDLTGHAGTKSAFPHYHFQMRLDGRQFINFNDFHVPFSDRDLFNLSLRDEPWAHHGFGSAGAGMQEAVSISPEDVLEHSLPVQDEAEGTYNISTLIMADNGPISGEMLHEIITEAKRTNKSVAYVAQQRLQGKAIVQTTISASDSIPDIAARKKPR